MDGLSAEDQLMWVDLTGTIKKRDEEIADLKNKLTAAETQVQYLVSNINIIATILEKQVQERDQSHGVLGDTDELNELISLLRGALEWDDSMVAKALAHSNLYGTLFIETQLALDWLQTAKLTDHNRKKAIDALKRGLEGFSK